MRTNVRRAETRTDQGRVVGQTVALKVVRGEQVATTAREPLTSGVLIIHDEHLRDQLEEVFGFRPYAFGR